MVEVGIRALKQNASEVVARVEAGEEITVTNRGRPVAVLSPAPAPSKCSSILGAMRGSVLGYDSPFAPAADPLDWSAAR